MADDSMARRGKGLEEEYFHRKEKELREKLRQQRAAEAARQELAEATGIPNEEILKTLQELGYTRDTVALLHFVPLLNVAWADNSVSPQEREMILEAARLHGVAEDSAAYKQLTEWLINRPSDEFFEHTLRIIGDFLESAPESAGTPDARGLLDKATRVAAASGGILGFGNKISDEERKQLERIAEALGKKRQNPPPLKRGR
jgi:tellurite resistance protein